MSLFGYGWTRGMEVTIGLMALFLAPMGGLQAADVTRPAEVAGVSGGHAGADVQLDWNPVTHDVAGHAETLGHYKIYRGLAPQFDPDTAGGSNLLGTSVVPQFVDSGAAAAGSDYFYLISAVDAAGNESATRPSTVTTPPVLTGHWTDTTIELQWSGALPASDVAGYRVYYGRTSHGYEFVKDVGTATSTALSSLQLFVNWYAAVVAVDLDGNESAFSNEHIDAIAGRVRMRAHDDDGLCWSGVDECLPDPGEIQRNGTWQLLVPVAFPEGDWTRVTVTFKLDSKLCTPPAQGTTTKCGDSNPGGYNPCGDPWDRIAQLFLVLDDCIETGGSCITPNNLELMRAVTPFGSDAKPPDGTGQVPARSLTLDITPYAKLLTGTRYVGAEIVNFTQAGWWVTVDFTFSERLDEASAKPPADGIQVVGLGGAPLPPKTVSIPAAASQVFMRLFTTGHGGASICDGGSNNGLPCNPGPCPGGVCNPCDEFCHRTNRILKNGAPVWTVVPYRTDCSPNGVNNCTPGSCKNWNACGCPSCTYPRAGWCPGYIACHQNAPCDQDINLTAEFPPGGTYDVGYDVLVQTGYWPVSLVLYWYE